MLLAQTDAILRGHQIEPAGAHWDDDEVTGLNRVVGHKERTRRAVEKDELVGRVELQSLNCLACPIFAS